MSVSVIVSALALVFILEGLLPLIAPNLWRETFQRLLTLSSGQIRFVGLFSVLTGIVLLFVFVS